MTFNSFWLNFYHKHEASGDSIVKFEQVNTGLF